MISNTIIDPLLTQHVKLEVTENASKARLRIVAVNSIHIVHLPFSLDELGAVVRKAQDLAASDRLPSGDNGEVYTDDELVEYFLDSFINGNITSVLEYLDVLAYDKHRQARIVHDMREMHPPFSSVWLRHIGVRK